MPQEEPGRTASVTLPKTWYEPEWERPGGTWAEPTAAFLGRQQVSWEEIERTREWFREACIRQHGSVVRAWKVMDLNCHARLTYFEFARGCKQMELRNARRVWCALGRSGFITLQDIDAKLGEQLAMLAGLIGCTVGSVEKAWRTCFNKTAKLRISHEDFKSGCDEMKFKGDTRTCFTELCSDKASAVTQVYSQDLKEFGFLHGWISGGTPDIGFLDRPPSRWDLPVEPWAPPAPDVSKGSRRKRFMECLLRAYGNMVRAWREGLDRDHNDRLYYSEFNAAAKFVGYAGNPKELWQELDINKKGYVSLWEIDEPTARLLREFVDTACSSFGSWAEFWQNALDVRGDDRVLYPEFRDGCLMLGWKEADIMFDLLDTGRDNYLSWSTSSWLAGPRKSHQRLLGRPRKRCFEGPGHEISGSHPGSTSSGPKIASNSHSADSKIPPALEAQMSQMKSVLQSTTSERQHDLPDWLLMAEGRMRIPEPAPKADLSFPLKPQQPGKGGWPSSKLCLVDEFWGGSKDLGLLLRPLTRAACSQHNLERWKKLATSAGGPKLQNPQ